MLPKLCRHRGKALAYVRIEGRQVYLGPWPEGARKPAPEAMARYQSMIGRIASGEAPEPMSDGRVTCAELAVAFLEAHFKSIDYLAYRGALAPVLALCGDTSAENFGPNRLRQIREWFLTHPVELGARGTAQAHKVARTRSGINKSLVRIRRVWKWGVSREMIGPEVLMALQALEPLAIGQGAPEAKPRLAVSRADVDAVLPHLAPMHQAMVRLQQLTAMRPGEVCAITTPEIERAGKTTWYYRPGAHKNAHRGKGRSIALNTLAIQILLPWLRADDKPLFSPALRMAERAEIKRQNRKTKVQPSQAARAVANPKNPPGDRYTTHAYGAAIRKACIRAGVSPWTPNQLRKLAANEVLRLGGQDLARALLGHPDAETTRRFYLESEREKAAHAASLLG